VKQFAAQEQQIASASRPQPATGSRRQQEGYILLTLLLVVALMGIFALAAYTTVEFEIRRDQETEMIHRGVQYTRAIRAYYKKFQRYPAKLEDLDSTSNLRYLRKHYKDPLNKNKDFRLLHFGEPGITLGGAIGSAMIPGANPAGGAAGLNGSGAGASAFGGGSGLGGSTLGGSGLGGSGLGNSGVNNSGVFAQPGLGGTSNTGGTNSNSQSATGAAGSDPTQAGSGAAQGDTNSGSQQLVASGPIVGVASLSDKATIRIFNKKKKYNEWQFMYDPAADRGGLITTPYQPALANVAAQPLQNGTQPGAAGNTSGTSSFGQSSGQSSFGQSSFGNNSSSGSQTAPPAPPSPPQQQQ
jgi:type II secretory pathway pseudopilin PulG